ncbi:MAG TPA: hypothetical protein VM840_02905 [Actinomycetota bacterium]|nr:hypothetical protein [Actinomycetota bacterium]
MAMRGGAATTRGFWTKRRRSAASLVAIIGLVSGIAIAYKLFDKTIPNNVVRDASSFNYVITAKDVAARETSFRPTDGAEDRVIFRRTLATSACGHTATSEECQVNTYPGDARRTDVIITNVNSPAKSASWSVYVPPSSVQVHSWNKATNVYTPVTAGTADYNTFLNFWTLRVHKQTYYNLPQGRDDYENNPDSDDSYAQTCSGRLNEFASPQSACELGVIRSAGTMGGTSSPLPFFPARRTDDRQYRFFMAEEDNGTDQSRFQGWRVTFSMVFIAQVPGKAENGRLSGYPVP